MNLEFKLGAMSIRIDNGRICIVVIFIFICLITGVGIAHDQPSNISTVQSGESIQDAIDSASPGDTIQVENGTYEEVITVDKSLQIIGSGDTTLDGSSFFSEDGVSIDASDVTLVDLKVTSYDTGIISQTNSGSVHLNDVEIIDNGGKGLDIDSQSVYIENSRINQNSGSGVEINGANITIQDTVTNSNGALDGNGIKISASEKITLENVESTDNANDGITTLGSATISVEGVVADDNSDDGLELEASNVTIQDSRTWNNGGLSGHGFKVSNADPVNVSNISSINNADDGLTIENAGSVNIQNVTTDENTDHGVEIDGTVITVNYVSATRNSDSGLQLDGTDISIRNSLATSNGDLSGSGFNLSSSGIVDVKNVSSNDNLDSGLAVFGSATVAVEMVEANGNGDHGLQLEGDDVTVRDSTTLNNGDLDGNGVKVSNANIVGIRNITTENNANDGLTVNNVGSVNIQNIITIGNSDDGLEVAGTEIAVDYISAIGNGGNGLGLDGPKISLQNGAANSNGDLNGNGLRISSVGNVTIQNFNMSNNFDNGVLLTGNAQVTVEDTVANSNSDDGLEIDARDITIQNSTTLNNGNLGENGIKIPNADTVLIRNADSRENDNDGITINGANSITIEDIVTTGNGDDGLELIGNNIIVRHGRASLNGNLDGNGVKIDSTGTVIVEHVDASENANDGVTFTAADDATVQHSSLTDNDDDELDNGDNSLLVVATHNWWGQPSGTEDGDCAGNVDCSDHKVNPPALFTSSPINQAAGETVQFDATITPGTVDTYEWDFTSDGQADAMGQQVTNAYGELGEYEVTLVVVFSDGQTDSISRTIQISEPTGAAFDFEPSNPVVDEEVAFDASQSTGAIEAYEWDFTGDGQIDATGQQATKAYDEPGEYEVTLRITFTNGQTDSRTRTVSVNDSLNATFSFEPANPVVDEEVTFDASQSTGAIEAYKWDFTGDEQIDATGQQATNAYREPEAYEVTLQITDSNGGTDTVTKTISVEDSELPPITGENPPQDLNGDGLYRDINGDGQFGISDVQIFFQNFNSDAVQNNPEAFNFDQSEPLEVTISDVQALFLDLTEE